MPGTDDQTKMMSAADLKGLATDIFAAAGVEAGIAADWASALVWANLRGVDSHGVLRIPRYIDLLRTGGINPTPQMRLARRTGAVRVLEADRAPGPVAMAEAMRQAIEGAKELGICWCAARNITHAGAVGGTAIKAAEAGLAGIVMTASSPLMAYHGARVSGVSTNPISIAFPRKSGAPLLLDMSTSTVALGKVMSAKDAGRPLGQGWAIGRNGAPTTDPNDVSTLTPLGGPKGSGLSLMIECLASLTVGNPVIAPALAAGGAGDSPVLNGTVIALDLSAIGDPAAIEADTDALADAILALPRADGVDRLYLPGGRGDEVHRTRQEAGIPVPAGTWKRLAATAQSLGIALS